MAAPQELFSKLSEMFSRIWSIIPVIRVISLATDDKPYHPKPSLTKANARTAVRFLHSSGWYFLVPEVVDSYGPSCDWVHFYVQGFPEFHNASHPIELEI